MAHAKKFAALLLLMVISITLSLEGFCQNNTQIRGFVDVGTVVRDGRLAFSLGEQDLFITSDLSDRFSFLGESVFKYDITATTRFAVSIERIVLKYNYKGNHNALIGKHHTPLNYWNDTYHHGRVFFPTITRPMIFSSVLFPLHTTGLSLQGLNLGKLKFGYDFMIGNGISSTDLWDDNKNKSITVAMHIKPRTGMRLGVSYYNDVLSRGTDHHTGQLIPGTIKEQLVTASVANFGEKVELLAESTLAITKSDSTAKQSALFSYVYAGYKLTDKIIPYVRVDNLLYPEEAPSEGSIMETKQNTSYLAGIRYQINYLAVIKLEYQHQYSGKNYLGNSLTTQIAIGF